jgi:hypothetical protein
LTSIRCRGPAPFIPPSPLLVFEDDQGRWTFDFAEYAPTFESMLFALAVANTELQRRTMGARA